MTALVILAGSILLLLLLIARWKVNAFLALLLAAFAVGVGNGLAPDAALKSMLKGIGDTMGSLALILAFGAILGKLIEESGAAHRITHWLTGLFGEKRIQLSIVITGFLVGLPMIYNASFLTLIPLIYTFSVLTRQPLMMLGIPLSSALSVTHGYLPPHPAPTAIAGMFGADVNLTLLYGLVLTPPAIFLAGPLLARCFRHVDVVPPPRFYTAREFKPEELPGLGVSLGTLLIPVVLMLTGAVVTMCWAPTGAIGKLVAFASDPTVALGTAVLAGLFTLGRARGRSMENLMDSVGAAVASVALVIFIIASGGAFKQVLIDSGTGKAIEQFAARLDWSPLVLAWCTAALLRLALGSATVAAITAAGVVLPLVQHSGVHPELMVLATASGSLMFSHFNDIGFWMFKEYYNVSIKQTFQIWTVMESIVAVVGLAGVLVFNAVLPARPVPTAAAQPRVFYLNSYHAGYAPSDEVQQAITQKLAGKAQLQTHHLDGKRQPSEAALRQNAAVALTAIRGFKPDLLIVSDDDAVKHVVVPHFRNGPLPVVFCGVNWDCAQYGLPTPHVTGLLEVVPVEEALRTLQRHFPAAKKLVVLSEDSTSERSNRTLLDPLYRRLGFEPAYALVADFAAWKAAFARTQAEADLVYLPTNGAIRGWDRAGAEAWVRNHLRKPVFTCDDFMLPYAVLGVTKVAREQGEWAAATALAILGGAKPADFPVGANRQSRVYLNADHAHRIGFQPDRDLAVRISSTAQNR
ncbi:MAG: TRAP transporter large permease subunit [Verrucomicrobia bacterium]|nr:TRAP transporter large permease subunit [Verrucomicrobiota bacterium]